MDKKRLIVSFVVAACISFIILLVSNDFGITWDEPMYMEHGDVYVSWLRHPTLSRIDRIFASTTDDVHPPFRKLIAGITHEILTKNLKIIDNTRGYRISALLFVFPFVLALTFMAIGQFGYVVGLLVPFMYTALPQVLYLTPLVTLDYAVAALWFIAVMTGIRGIKSYFWLTISGVCVGLTMLTKLHGYLLFIPVLGFIAWKRQEDSVKKIFIIIIAAFATYIVGWPWLWTSPLSHLIQYIRLQSAFATVPEYIFGRTYLAVSWWYTPVMFLVTTPVYILFMFFIGAWWAIRRGRIWDRLMLANALYPIVFFSLPGVYRHDWVRLFLPAYPFVILVAGRGFTVSIKFLQPRLRKAGFAVLTLLWVITVFTSIVRIHPLESAYYNELVGGISGAARLGFESEFWGNAYLGVLPWMNAHKKNMMCVTPTTNPFYYYQAMGQIEPGVVFNAGRGACDYLVVLMRQGFFVKDPFVVNAVRTQKPIYSVSLDGVPLVGVYDIRNIRE